MSTDRNRTPEAAHDGPPRKRLPIGIQSFREMREGGFYYVDKTPWIERLVAGGKHYFLSRPKRFGMSLLVDTIAELLAGSQRLFQGLDIADRWNWSVRSQVLRLDFSSGDFSSTDRLRQEVLDQLDALAEAHGVPTRYDSPSSRLRHLIRRLHERTGERVALLIDEYDKPILDVLRTKKTARANRDFLRGFYATIKTTDAHLRFTLLTGVSRFSRVSLFSGLNNLRDITLDPRYGAICGYTEANLDSVFASELGGLDRTKIRDWYNGYAWGSGDPVYNPFDLLLLFDSRRFEAWWCETGTPTFLVDLLTQRKVDAFALDGALASHDVLSAFDVGAIEPEALLFQTGYLTIRGAEDFDGETTYQLGYPNREVRLGLNRSLLTHLTDRSVRWAEHRTALYEALREADFEQIESLLRSLFAGVPHEWHTRNDIPHYEGYYASVLYSCFAALGLDVRVEDSSAGGRVDLALRFEGSVFLFELKVRERSRPGAALEQLRARRYADKHRAEARAIHLVGIEFSEETRGIVRFDAEALMGKTRVKSN